MAWLRALFALISVFCLGISLTAWSDTAATSTSAAAPAASSNPSSKIKAATGNAPTPADSSKATTKSDKEAATPIPASTLATNNKTAPTAGHEAVKTQIQNLVSESRGDIRQAISELSKYGDPIAIRALKLLKEKRLRKDKAGRVYAIDEDETEARDYFTGEKVKVKIDDLTTPSVNSPIRSMADTAIYSIQLFSKKSETRLTAATELAEKSEPQTELTALLQKALDAEKVKSVTRQLRIVLAKIHFASDDEAKKLKALKLFKQSDVYPPKDQLLALLKQDKNKQYVVKNVALRDAALTMLHTIERREYLKTFVNWLLEGSSEGSILLLAAIGLAVTFGLMGVINMAHGEMIMLGAFTTYAIQLVFQAVMPQAFQPYYLIAAIPSAFVVSGLVGIGIERTIVRHLYGRPLDTLLATWGLSLIVIQAIKLIYSANNVPIKVPEYLVGSMTLFSGVSISYVRISIILFAIFVMVLVWFIMRRTSFGLQLRAVTQNRSMASSMGITTDRVDMWAFGLGSGIAGLAGVALSQYTNVGYAMGQSFIIMSFLVVVIGGVGNLSGMIWGALIIGFTSKLVELWVGANLKEFVLLGLVILFIQFRPQGIFPQKGRAVED